MILSEALALSPTSWLDAQGPSLSSLGALNCFVRANVTPDEVDAPHRIIHRVGQITLSALAAEYRAPIVDPLELRAHLLEYASREGRSFLQLHDLLDYCWMSGIPVVHVRSFGDSIKKMDAAVANVEGRPVIAICRDDKAFAKICFKLAHELGHIAMNHWQEFGLIAETEMTKPDERDLEQAANRYAISLLYGDPDYSASHALDEWGAGWEMEARSHGIDPHAFLLVYLRENGGYNRLGLLEKRFASGQDARHQVLETLFKHVKLESLGKESQRQLVSLMEASDFGSPSC